jgi:hypothetical protein
VASANAGTGSGLTGAAIVGNLAQSIAVTLNQLICIRLITSAGAAVASHNVTLAIRVDA